MVWSTGYSDTKDDSPIKSDYVSSAISEFRDSGGDGDSSTPFYDQRVSSPINLQKEIKQFRTEIPQMTRAEFLRDPRVNISPYSREAVNIDQQDDDGFIAVPADDLQPINMTMGIRTDLTGNMGVPYARKGFFERAGEKLSDAFGGDDREQRVVMTGGDRPELQGTYGVKSENTLQDVIANVLNPFGFIGLDSRRLAPFEGGEDVMLSQVRSPFGVGTNLTPYSEIKAEPTIGDDSQAPVETMVAEAAPRRRLVPMGNQAYTPYGYNPYTSGLGSTYRSPYNYSISGLLG